MSISVGKAIRQLSKNGLAPNYFLLGNDTFLQKIFISLVLPI